MHSRAEPKSLPRILSAKPAKEAAPPENPLFRKAHGVEHRTSLALRNPPAPKLGEAFKTEAGLLEVEAEGPTGSATETEDLENLIKVALAMKRSSTLAEPAEQAEVVPTSAVLMFMSGMTLTTGMLERAESPFLQTHPPKVYLLAVVSEVVFPARQEPSCLQIRL